ncbi:hypothetical protein N431DRAFT_395306 [Stipitochalara longipes BDJ]|nr:hypothetical protein N431DRAFT_395306 [Stipitochalara longipes BDJ]
MRRLFSISFSQLAAYIVGVSSGTVYITDLPIFSALAPCAGSAVSYVVQGLTEESCAPSVTALESCACTQDHNSAAIVGRISTNVLDYCGSTAADDVTSADFVFSAYCNQAAAVTIPTGGPVTQYITDLPAFANLGGCAQSAISYAVQPLTGSICPPAASLLASCACIKDQNSLYISEKINTYIGQMCGTTHTEDSTSAQAVFSGYCGMEAGTTAFPSPSYLPGDVTYYITDLPSYSSLATCAQFAVSYPVMPLGNDGGDCPSAPLGFVSCACVKDQNSQALTSAIISQAKEQCGTTADSDVSSALGVFAYYCSAGKGLVTPTGVTASVTTNPYGGVSTGLSGIFPSSTGNSPDCSDPLSCIGLPASTHIPLGAIIGGAAGGIVFIIFILVAGWRYRRRRLPRQPPFPIQQYTPHVNNNSNESGKAELAGTSTFSAGKLSKNPSMSIVSPVSPMEEKENPLPAGRLEMEAQYAVLPGRTEMEAQNRSAVSTRLHPQELHPEHARYEVQGQPHARELGNATPSYEVQGSNQHPVEVPALSANMISGPYYELEGPYR